MNLLQILTNKPKILQPSMVSLEYAAATECPFPAIDTHQSPSWQYEVLP